MSRRHRRRTGPEPLELLEEAVHLLRLSPWSILGVYYFGSLPFVLGLLYFWADMSRGSAAYEHCAPAAFAVSVLFLWMKTWQAIFARRLRSRITGRSEAALTFSGFFRTALNQTILQPSGLFLLPLSLVFVLPFGWIYAFYQNITAFGAEGLASKHVFQRAVRQAQLWPKQNHFLLAALLLFGAIVFLDVAIGLATVPSLLKTLLGIETAFTRSPWGLLNTTFAATVGALTYLCLDPLVKAAYLLRCFYGESLHTGEDLRAELRQFVPDARAAALVLLLVVMVVKTMAGLPGEAIDGSSGDCGQRASVLECGGPPPLSMGARTLNWCGSWRAPFRFFRMLWDHEPKICKLLWDLRRDEPIETFLSAAGWIWHLRGASRGAGKHIRQIPPATKGKVIAVLNRVRQV